jgi:hypothetical protein
MSLRGRSPKQSPVKQDRLSKGTIRLKGDCFVGISALSHLNPPRNDTSFVFDVRQSQTTPDRSSLVTGAILTHQFPANST